MGWAGGRDQSGGGVCVDGHGKRSCMNDLTEPASVFFSRDFPPCERRSRNTPAGRRERGLRGRGGAAESQARKGRPSPVWCWRPVRPLNTDAAAAAAFIRDRCLSEKRSDASTSPIFTFKADRQTSIARTDRESRSATGAAASLPTCGSPAPDRPRVMGNTPAAKRGNEMESGGCL